MFRSSLASTSSPSGPFPASRREEGHATEPVRILRWSLALRERILTAPPEAGRVHSVFERALNILWHDGALVALHGPAPLAAPFAAAVTRLPEAGRLTPGTEVFKRENRILLGPCVLDIEGGTLVDTTIHPINRGPGLLASALKALAMPAGAPGLSSPSGRSAQRRLADGILNRDAQAFIEGACALVGLGEGLTPAGDDCLVGALAVLRHFAHRWLEEQPEIRAAIGAAARVGTTMVGRDFILHALDGAFSEAILHLVTTTSERDARRTVAYLAETGGTSGADTLHGICLALEALEFLTTRNHIRSIRGRRIHPASGVCSK